MTLSVPKEPTYQFVPGDHAITYWLPEEVVQEMIDKGKVKPEILRDYPDGVEVYVVERDLDRFHKKYGLDLKMDIGAVNQAYDLLKKAGRIPKDGMVKASALEGLAKSSGNPTGSYEPEMTDGEDWETVGARLCSPGRYR